MVDKIKETYRLNILLKEWTSSSAMAQPTSNLQVEVGVDPDAFYKTSRVTHEETAHTSRLAELISRHFSVPVTEELDSFE